MLFLAAAPSSQSSLETMSEGLLSKVAAAGFEAPFGVFIEGPDPVVSRAVGTVLCGRFARAKLECEIIEAPSAALAIETARNQGLASVLRLSVSRVGATVVVRGDVLETWKNFWAGDVARHVTRATAVSISVEVDSELMTLTGASTGAFSRSTIPGLRLSSIARWNAAPLAVAVGDLDGDRKAEIAVLVAEDVFILSPDGTLRGRFDLSVADPAPAPLREPFGALSMTSVPPRLVAWSGQRAKAEVLLFSGSSLKSVGNQDTVSLDAFTVRLEPGLNRFQSDVQRGGKALRLARGFQAISARGGVTLVVWPDGTASLGTRWPLTNRLADVGTGSALADLDRDGTPEVLLSTARTVGDTDELWLFSLSAAERLAATGQTPEAVTPLWHTALKGRAMTMTSGDLDGDGTEEFVFGTWLSDGSGELWVARKDVP
jgi:hypothetical protein